MIEKNQAELQEKCNNFDEKFPGNRMNRRKKLIFAENKTLTDNKNAFAICRFLHYIKANNSSENCFLRKYSNCDR